MVRREGAACDCAPARPVMSVIDRVMLVVLGVFARRVNEVVA